MFKIPCPLNKFKWFYVCLCALKSFVQFYNKNEKLLHFRVELDADVESFSWIVAHYCHFHSEMAQDCAVPLCYSHLTSFLDIFEFNQGSYLFFMRDYE